jgi:hypothetical protein
MAMATLIREADQELPEIDLNAIPSLSNPDLLLGILRSTVKNDVGRWKAIWLETHHGMTKVKLPKFLRELAELELDLGAPVRVWLDPEERSTARALIPLQAKLVISGGCKKTCVAVCSSKSCCRKGGKKLYQQLCDLSSTSDLEVRKCGCLKSCKSGPMVKVDGRVQALSLDTPPSWLPSAQARFSKS